MIADLLPRTIDHPDTDRYVPISWHYGLALGFFTPLITLTTQLADLSDPMTMLTDRGIDTLIGVAAGMAMAVLIRRPQRLAERVQPRSAAFRT